TIFSNPAPKPEAKFKTNSPKKGKTGIIKTRKNRIRPSGLITQDNKKTETSTIEVPCERTERNSRKTVKPIFFLTYAEIARKKSDSANPWRITLVKSKIYVDVTENIHILRTEYFLLENIT